jgi:hypothetical protein
MLATQKKKRANLKNNKKECGKGGCGLTRWGDSRQWHQGTGDGRLELIGQVRLAPSLRDCLCFHPSDAHVLQFGRQCCYWRLFGLRGRSWVMG